MANDVKRWLDLTVAARVQVQVAIAARGRGIRLGVDRKAQLEVFVFAQLVDKGDALLDAAVLQRAFAGADKEDVEV